MHILSAKGEPVALELVAERPVAEMVGSDDEHSFGRASLVAAAASAFLLSPAETSRSVGNLPHDAIAQALRRVSKRAASEPVAVFRERQSGLVRTVKREVVIRFTPGLSERKQRSILKKHGLTVRRHSAIVPDQLVVADPGRRKAGVSLVEIANDWATLDEVLFATPNFISEYRRAVTVPDAQWHLDNRARVNGQLAEEDVRALGAWDLTPGRRTIVVAVLDDGVDIDHPDLRSRIRRRRGGPDKVGRDFFLPDDHADHYNPRPKQFQFPYWDLTHNDIHGTPCAGLVAAAGGGAYGVAHECRILPVKVLHADAYAQDERIAEAIRYATANADVMSISWTGPSSPDIENALGVDAQRDGRGGRGTAAVCAAGNDGLGSVSLPAAFEGPIAVGASTDEGKLASYSNTGSDLDIVAPSSGGRESIFSTDVSIDGRGYSTAVNATGTAALYTERFEGTSASTPLVAGVIALMLSANAALDRESIRDILGTTAQKIGDGYDAAGHSHRFGHGRVNAAAAVQAAVEARG